MEDIAAKKKAKKKGQRKHERKLKGSTKSSKEESNKENRKKKKMLASSREEHDGQRNQKTEKIPESSSEEDSDISNGQNENESESGSESESENESGKRKLPMARVSTKKKKEVISPEHVYPENLQPLFDNLMIREEMEIKDKNHDVVSRIVKVPGDGNCWLRAVAVQLDLDFRQLKQAYLSFLQQNSALLQSFYTTKEHCMR